MASAVVFCVALLLAFIAGVHPVPQAGTSSCTTDLFRLLPCLPFVDGTAAVPPDTCCSNLGSMVHDEPQCLCQALSQPSASPVAINMSRVLAMPRLCRLDLPASAAGACTAGLLPQGPAPPLPVSAPRPSANSTAPSTLTPATPTAPHMTPSPWMSSQLPRYSRGSKVILDGFSVALGFVALVSVLAF
ncbi:non-specific lipid-transfer protein C6-like [Phragmites australis]|uniref:non-specific lipid-transfer protein C6-like n=1 Tax=Phragmites australis TaxID=29695 RepID=UPI002D77402B|nr:non-specific lipid-transfer protein C6-like [Phragmites australis]